MATDAQINANRDNSSRSTGPRTEAGKRRARMNGLKHGAFLAGDDEITATLLKEDYDDLQALHEALIDDLSPASTVQYALAEHIAQTIINQLRLRKLTTALVDGQALDDDEVAVVGQDHLRLDYVRELGRAIASRHRDVDPDIRYMFLAGVEYTRVNKSKIPPPKVDPEVGNPWEAARRELFRILEVIYGSLDAAFDDCWNKVKSLEVSADDEERKIRAIEAQRLIGTFDKVSSLSDRVARSIARSLKEYRALKYLEASLIDQLEEGGQGADDDGSAG